MFFVDAAMMPYVDNILFSSFENFSKTLYEHSEPLWQHIREWRTNVAYQNLLLITRLHSSTVNLKPSSDLTGTYWLLSNVLCWCHMSTIFYSYLSKISALSKSDTKLYVLLHVKQPKFHYWATFNYGIESHRKDMMLHAWRDFRLLLVWGWHWNFEISCLHCHSLAKSTIW